MTEAEIEGVASAIRNASTYTATYPFTVFDPAQPAANISEWSKWAARAAVAALDKARQDLTCPNHGRGRRFNPCIAHHYFKYLHHADALLAQICAQKRNAITLLRRHVDYDRPRPRRAAIWDFYCGISAICVDSAGLPRYIQIMAVRESQADSHRRQKCAPSSARPRPARYR